MMAEAMHVSPAIGLLGLLGLIGLVAIPRPVATHRRGGLIRLLGLAGLVGLAGFWNPWLGACGALGAFGVWNHQGPVLRRLAWAGFAAPLALLAGLAMIVRHEF